MAQNVHINHRQRMRKRFIETNGVGFSDYELLELLLYYGIPQKDTNVLAHNVLDHFGSYINFFEASPEELSTVNGIGETSAILLALPKHLSQNYDKHLIQNKETIKSLTQAKRICCTLLKYHTKETLYMICLDASRHVIRKLRISEGSLSQITVYERTLVELALRHNAHSIILTHNHPHGSCKPSIEDIDFTSHVVQIFSLLQIEILDHIIVADNQHIFSFRQADFLSNQEDPNQKFMQNYVIEETPNTINP